MILSPGSVKDRLAASLAETPKPSLQVQVRAARFLSRMKKDLQRQIRDYASEVRSQPKGTPIEPFEYAFESSGSLFLMNQSTLNTAGINNLRAEIDRQLTVRGFDPQVVVACCSHENIYSIVARFKVELPQSEQTS